LELHGVFVNRILVAVPRDKLSVAAQDALLQIQETTTICLDYLVERMRIHRSPSDGSAATKTAPNEAVNSVEGIVNLAIGPVPYHRVKRLIDLVGAAMLLITLAPLFLLLGALVAADVGLPLVFWQQRPGLHKRPFKLYKFRTMAHAHDADGRRESDNARISVV